MATKIILDAGHGGTDPGAVYDGRQEKDDVLALTLALGEALSELGYDVEYTRTTDTYDSPVQKARIGNASGADYFVSLHRNSSPNANQYDGVQTLVYNDAGVKGQLGRNINSELEKLGFKNLNVDERPELAVLRRTNMPAVLLEIGFINSDKDNMIFDDKFDEIVAGIAKGIDETLSPSVFSNNASSAMENSLRTRNALFNNEDEEYNDYADEDYSPNINGEEQMEAIGGRKGACKKRGYQILIGIYRGFSAAAYQMNRMVNDGYDADVYEDDGLYQVRIGDYRDIDEALEAQKGLRDKGYCTLIVNSF